MLRARACARVTGESETERLCLPPLRWPHCGLTWERGGFGTVGELGEACKRPKSLVINGRGSLRSTAGGKHKNMEEAMMCRNESRKSSNMCSRD
ncbi:hypothetical protein GOODEAATRI_013395 [Goodea atripinnis]|uniref:Uncharacterized protein n=1 Tax=Goodea atripinnis TaxID=208336 RepID=A0ABV0MHG5_9TELE